MLIKIHPTIDFKAKCPRDGAELKIEDFVIPSMRCLVSATCPECQSQYYVDLPVSQALWSPVTLDIKTGEAWDPNHVQWFSERLKNSFFNQTETNIVPVVHKFFEADRIIVFNCLDFLYGHCLLKLLNVQRYLEEFPEYGCCVLVPTQLVHLVPDGVAEIWEMPLPIKDGWKWLPSLNHWLKQQILNRQECFLSLVYSHPSNKVYDLRKYVRNLPDFSHKIEDHEPVILFSYREDRLWGRTLPHQQRNIQKLYKRLSAIFPRMLFVIVGFGCQNKITETASKIIDLRVDPRVNKFEQSDDLRWLSYMSIADCVVGVHGSSMLLPSGLARTTVELLPKFRYNNLWQDILLPYGLSDLREAVMKYRFVPGNDDLSDVRTSTVSDVVISVLAHGDRALFWLNFGESDEQVFMPRQPAIRKAGLEYFANSEGDREPYFTRKLKRLLQEFLHYVDILSKA